MADFGASEWNPPYTQGTLGRYVANVAAPDGLYGLTIPPAFAKVGNEYAENLCVKAGIGCDFWDADATPQAYGLIAIGVSCEEVPTPTPTPVPPTPTPTPTRAPTPSVYIQEPEDGFTQYLPNPVHFTIVAHGSVKLTKIELWGYQRLGQTQADLLHTDDASGTTDKTASFDWQPAGGRRSVRLFARVTDVTGGVGESETISGFIDVVEDTPTPTPPPTDTPTAVPPTSTPTPLPPPDTPTPVTPPPPR